MLKVWRKRAWMAEEFLGENFSRLKSGQWKIPLYIFDTVFKYRKAPGMLFFFSFRLKLLFSLFSSASKFSFPFERVCFNSFVRFNS